MFSKEYWEKEKELHYQKLRAAKRRRMREEIQKHVQWLGQTYAAIKIRKRRLKELKEWLQSGST